MSGVKSGSLTPHFSTKSLEVMSRDTCAALVKFVFQPDMYSCLPGYPHQKKKNSVSAFATCVQDESSMLRSNNVFYQEHKRESRHKD